jgi:hypothetical protein
MSLMGVRVAVALRGFANSIPIASGRTRTAWATLSGLQHDGTPREVGFVLGQGVTSLQRRRRLRAHWAALDAEITICGRQARAYLRDNVAAPLYRLPTMASAASFPRLLSEKR